MKYHFAEYNYLARPVAKLARVSLCEFFSKLEYYYSLVPAVDKDKALVGGWGVIGVERAIWEGGGRHDSSGSRPLQSENHHGGRGLGNDHTADILNINP